MEITEKIHSIPDGTYKIQEEIFDDGTWLKATIEDNKATIEGVKISLETFLGVFKGSFLFKI